MKKKTCKRQSNCSFVALAVFSSVPLSAFLTATPAQAQMGLEDAMANESAAMAMTEQEKSMDYTFKSGDFKVLLIPALSMSWNNNVNCTETNLQSSLVITPTLGIAMSYPLTDRNLLQLNVTAGYSEYVQHPSLSTWYLQAGSGLSFNFYIKDVMFNVHDQFSYVQNTAQNPEVAGTGTYGTFNNSAGIVSSWSLLKYLDLSVGYDHQNTVATSSQFNQSDSATESAYSRLGYKLNSKLTTGLEGTVAYTHYNQDILNDNTSYSGGVYGEWDPDSFLRVEPHAGYSYDQVQQTSELLQTENLGSWYADVSINHSITRSMSYSINAGRNINPGVQSDLNEYWFVNGSIIWNFVRNFSFQPQLFFQHGQQGVGSTFIGSTSNDFLLTQPETYTWYGGGLTFNYTITKRFTASLNYEITQRNSSIANRGYTQNVVGIQITYRPI